MRSSSLCSVEILGLAALADTPLEDRVRTMLIISKTDIMSIAQTLPLQMARWIIFPIFWVICALALAYYFTQKSHVVCSIVVLSSGLLLGYALPRSRPCPYNDPAHALNSSFAKPTHALGHCQCNGGRPCGLLCPPPLECRLQPPPQKCKRVPGSPSPAHPVTARDVRRSALCAAPPGVHSHPSHRTCIAVR